jgi:hypothetical protein
VFKSKHGSLKHQQRASFKAGQTDLQSFVASRNRHSQKFIGFKHGIPHTLTFKKKASAFALAL